MLIPFSDLFSRHGIRPRGILHLGANTGQEAEAYYRQGDPQVIWVEALEPLYLHLVRTIAPYPRQRALLACIGEEDGREVVFHVANNGGQSSSLLEFGTHTSAHPSVRYVSHVKLTTSRVDTLLARHSIAVGPDWFLNIDLQGAELIALRSMGSLLAGFRYAYIEVNEKPLYQGCPLVDEIDTYLARYGFIGREVKMTNWGWGDKFYLRR